jgi:hypothetical protein
MHVAIRRTVRSIAATLSAVILLNQFSYAAAPQDPAPDVSSSSSAVASAPPQVANAPVPAQIAASHSVFLANLGADANFPIDATQAYNGIYQALQAWGHYQLTSSPEQADLIFQLRGVSSLTTYVGEHGSTYTINHPSFELTIVDAKSNVALWTITSPVGVAGHKQVLARWVALSESNLVSRIEVVAGQSLTPTETADLTLYPKNHRTRTVLLLVGAIAGAGIAGGLILHHEYDNSLASQKQSQDTFCEANDIPLSECAGG